MPSTANTEPGPKMRLRFGWTFIKSSVLARNTCRTNAGSDITTVRPKNGTLIVNTGPYRAIAFRIIQRRNPAKATPWMALGNGTAGGCLSVPGIVEISVLTTAASVIGNHSQPLAWYHHVPRVCVVRYRVVPARRKGFREVDMTTALNTGASVDDAFRDRLLDGLAESIGERGYRDTTVADIVRHAGTSKRTFYEQFASKEECLIELLRRNNEDLIAGIRAAVDPEADWQEQIRQAAVAYVDHIGARPAITLSWIREAPALGVAAQPLHRLAME